MSHTLMAMAFIAISGSLALFIDITNNGIDPYFSWLLGTIGGLVAMAIALSE